VDSDALLQVIGIFGGLATTLGAALVFTVRYIVRRGEKDLKLITDAFGKTTSVFETTMKDLSFGMEKQRKSFFRLRKQIQEALPPPKHGKS
jgi:hypothetical protein